ncbi:hypothetical protein OHT76_02090 [Streptomyces sp. NBC_00287]|uniref:SCO4225 family membrane protein n=1 Tax=Streptomyces sp. NBC_00287 TaxID=2975702 RepID=UPI002E2A1BD1|nr:hypothetical protein [Streptomyces sp. NBC_00287]
MTTFRRCFLNPAALGYLAVVVAVWVWVAVDLLFVEHPDASLAGVWAFLVTAPTSLFFVWLPGPLPWIGLVVGAVAQAGVLGALYRALFDGSRRTGTSNA